MAVVPSVRCSGWIAVSFGCTRLLDPLRLLVHPVLMEDRFRDAPCAVRDERDLRIDGLEEEVVVGLGKDLETRLRGGLREESVVLARDGNDERRRELVLADVALEHGRIDGDRLPLLRRGGRSFDPLGAMVAVLMKDP